MNATEVLIPPTRTAMLAGQRVEIKPLTLRQLLGAFALLRTQRAQVSLPPDAPDSVAALAYFEAAGEKLPDLLALITGLPAAQLVDVSLLDLSGLAVAVAEVNDFGAIFANFQQAAAKLNPAKK